MHTVWAQMPVDLQFPAAFHHRPGVGANDSDSAKGTELSWLVIWQRRNFDYFLNTLHFERFTRIERPDLAAIHWRAGDHGDLHAGNSDVGPVIGTAGTHVVIVDDRHILTDVLPLRLVLQPHYRSRFASRDIDACGDID